jgi:DNA-binding MarR family transcriptional regulator
MTHSGNNDMHELIRQRILDSAREVPGVDPDTMADAVEFGRLSRRVDAAVDEYFHGFGLSRKRFEVLKILYHHPRQALTPAELADDVVLTRQAMTSALDGLERKGLVQREGHPVDRRKVLIRITPKGRDTMGSLLPEHYRDMTRVMDKLTTGERRTLLSLYRRGLEGIRELVAEKQQATSDETNQ